MTADTEVTALDLLAQEFGDIWQIMRSDAGRWWATRHKPIAGVEDVVGCSRTVDADTPAKLSQRFAEQAKLIQQAADITEILRVLETTYPGWSTTYDGHWRADRTPPITSAQAAAGVVASLSTPSYEEFTEQLAKQATLIDRCGGYNT
ncbi:hypothetical protein OG884_05570 [Streptosporangium sp. NBC_01755]|uniref:hypothetical protein n=1 Tax=Streptosporangium sp. NBC_01755 TaxID=2975949 RepID=UPI002DD9F8D1|nr:hypothetical protein [Streptosporangium sp. NBC_01755]WSD01393.1 hypothetical protein OG884_05570 [Streptosporangium sp. NBC_01755]